jgi:hypothetical protein
MITNENKLPRMADAEFIKEMEESVGRLTHLLHALRARQLRSYTLTDAERDEFDRIDEENRKDDEQARWGNASRDGMK